MYWLSGENITNMNELLKMPVLDYWFMLDDKYKTIRAAQSKNKKAGK